MAYSLWLDGLLEGSNGLLLNVLKDRYAAIVKHTIKQKAAFDAKL